MKNNQIDKNEVRILYRLDKTHGIRYHGVTLWGTRSRFVQTAEFDSIKDFSQFYDWMFKTFVLNDSGWRDTDLPLAGIKKLKWQEIMRSGEVMSSLLFWDGIKKDLAFPVLLERGNAQELFYFYTVTFTEKKDPNKILESLELLDRDDK